MEVLTVDLTVSSTIHEMERLRMELYKMVNGKRDRLNHKKTCEVSQELDKLIVKHMYEDMSGKLKMDIFTK